MALACTKVTPKFLTVLRDIFQPLCYARSSSVFHIVPAALTTLPLKKSIHELSRPPVTSKESQADDFWTAL